MANKTKNSKIKILQVIGDAGAGHMAPAMATQQALEKLYGDEVEIEIIDIFTLADVPPFNTSEVSYELFTRNYTLQIINNLSFRIINSWPGYLFMRAYTVNSMFEPTLRLLDQYKPDIIITNNPFVTWLFEAIKFRVGGFFSVSQVTDMEVFLRGCADRAAELVISPSKEATQNLIRYGVSPDRIVDPLFPVRADLQKIRSKQEILKELGFDAKRPIIMVAGGGLGMVMLVKAIEQMLDFNLDWQLMVFTGKLDSLKAHFDRKYEGNSRVRVFSFINNIQDYYSIADVVVAKPGMSTVVETELFEKKVVLTRVAGENERGNVIYALRNPRYRYVGDKMSKLPAVVAELLNTKINPKTVKIHRNFGEAEEIAKLIMQGYGSWRGRK